MKPGPANIFLEKATAKTISVSAPSRLHFGLFSIGRKTDRRFGGAGVMIQNPRTTITMESNPNLEIVGESIEWLESLIHQWFQFAKQGAFASSMQAFATVDQLPVKASLQSTPPRHCGLGSGTQTAFCCAVAATRFFELPVPAPNELASAMNRGKRSAIGSYGFFQGGFLVDRGITNDSELSPLDFRMEFPDWPIMLLLPNQSDHKGLYGKEEEDVFSRLPDSLPTGRDRLIELVNQEIVPGLVAKDYERFGEGLFQFGYLSGEWFSEAQSGPYHGKEVTNLVTSIREFDLPAVGQTSWGPGVFAIARDQNHCHEVAEKIRNRFGDQFEITNTRADNSGFRTNCLTG